MNKIITLLLTSLLFYTSDIKASAPAKESFKDSLSKANLLFDAKAYALALPLYQYLFENHQDKKKTGFYKYRLGICSLYKTDQHEKALGLLSEVFDENKKAADIEFYLARAFMLNYKFDDAVVRFTSYIIKPKASPELKILSEQYIENCNNGKEMVSHPIDVKITNIGGPINTAASEYVPVISSDESVLIFTYRGERSTGGAQALDVNDPDNAYTEDVFMSAKAGGEWLDPFGAGPNINSYDHDACIALSGDGQKLFVFKNGGNDNGDIYMSFLNGNNWSAPEHLRGDVNSNFWEGSCSISANERILYFSSERPGGFGGRDLYRAILQHDGSWGDVKNLGPKINTEFDDDAPFIHPDGTTLIFSSKGHKSMGGYDIFKTFRMDTSWTNPENMGYPVNTPGDDIYYVLSADGQRGYYSTEKAGGHGEHDIYIVGPGLVGWKPALILLKGNITLNDLPAQADVEVLLANNSENVGIYKSNTSTGKYLVNLPAGTDYKVIYRKFGYEDQVKQISNTSADSYSEISYDVKFYNKLTLTYAKLENNIMTPGLQKGRKNFAFTDLPEDSLLLFLLEGKGADTIQEVSIVLNGITRPSTRCKENYFCLRNSTNVVLAKKTEPVANPEEPASTSSPSVAVAIPAETASKPAEVPFGKAENYPDIVKKFGEISAEGLEFKIQIGAYRNPQNFKYENLTPLGKVSNKNYEDQITRFTMGSFSTLNDADQFLKKITDKGRSDAFVTAFYNGQRFLLKELGTLRK